MCGNVIVQRGTAQLLRQFLCPLGDAQPFQKDPLWGQFAVLNALRGLRQSLEIDMRGQITTAGFGQWI